MDYATIGVDLGATNIKGVLLGKDGEIQKQLSLNTNEKDGTIWKKNVKEIIETLKNNSGLNKAVVGLSAPGLADSKNECIQTMPGRFNGLEGFNWCNFLNFPTFVLNDAHAALLAEASVGAGKGYQNIIMLTLGTGVGGGIFMNGKLQQGLFQRAGHIGHTTVEAGSNNLDITNMPGSLENAIGDCTVLERTFGKFHTTKELVKGYLENDTLATYVWLHAVNKLAVALCGLINILSPEIIIIGGGIASADDALFIPLKQFMDIYEWRQTGDNVPVIKAKYGEYSGAIGAACFAAEKNSNKIF